MHKVVRFISSLNAEPLLSTMGGVPVSRLPFAGALAPSRLGTIDLIP